MDQLKTYIVEHEKNLEEICREHEIRIEHVFTEIPYAVIQSEHELSYLQQHFTYVEEDKHVDNKKNKN